MMLPRKGEQIKIDIDNLAFGGMGVGKIDDYVVFVEGAITGETVTAEIYKRKKDYAEARLVQVENESPFRVEPRCKHFPLCGGCRLQHIVYDKQVEYKKMQLVDSFRQIGRFDEPPVSKVFPSQSPFYYRNKMEYSFGNTPEGELLLGLHPRKQFRKVFNLEECYLQSEHSANLVVALRNTSSKLGLLPYDIKKHTGLLRYFVVREGKNTGQRMLNVVTSESAINQVRDLFENALKDVCEINSVVNNVNTKKATIAYGEYENIVHGVPYIIEDISGIKYRISANSFFQPNSLTAVRLFDIIVDYADCNGRENVLDLYCGTGSISFAISGKVSKVTGVDSEESAIDDARGNAEFNNINNCEFYVADSKDYLSVLISEGKKFDIVIADPPRAGVHPKMIPMLGQLGAPKLIYVSCNPAALARDYITLKESGYTLKDITCIDMFPQTPHIEAVALFANTDYL